MRKTVDLPYEADRYSYYGVIHHRADGKTLPMTYENTKGETVVVTRGRTEDGTDYYTLETHQKNGWCEIATYYADGTTEESYEKI